jgi:hypothetical protein
MREFAVGGRTIKVMSRLADNDQLARLFEPQPTSTWSDPSPVTDTAVAVAVSGNDSQTAVEPLAFSLPGTPDGLVFQMNDRGDGHLFAVGEDRLSLGSDGMWWIVTRIVEALEDPQTVSTRKRFLTVSGSLGGPATQASLQYSDTGICVVWRRLESGVVGDVTAWQELSHERAQGWLNMLRPIVHDLERQQVHHDRLLPARTAERWVAAMERWSA